MKKYLLLPILLIGVKSYTQNFIQAYKTRADLVTQTNINTNLTDFTNLGVKTTGSVANNNAATWLKNKYTSFGYAAADITMQTFVYSGKNTQNVIVSKTGTLYPDQFIIICGHYDTIVGPGTNDNGSGVSIILEAARILKNVPTDYSIKFINFSGEEQGLFGSQAYVTNIVKATNPRMDIKLVLNIDEVGGIYGMTNNKIITEKDGTPAIPSGMYSSYPSTNNAASAAKTTELKNSLLNYSTITPVDGYIERSDYMPFEKEGFVVTGLYEFNESTKPHTAGDTYANMDPVYVYNIAKGVIGALQHFAGAGTTVLGTSDVKVDLKDRVGIFPNPANEFINIGVDGKDFVAKITDMSGKNILSSTEQIINTSSLKNGMYILTVTENGQSTSKKFMIKK